MRTEITWGLDGSFISLTMTDLDDGQSGTLVISGRGVRDPGDPGVFAEANAIEELDAAQQELVVRCWNPDSDVHDGMHRYYIPLSDELYAAIYDVRESGGISVG